MVDRADLVERIRRWNSGVRWPELGPGSCPILIYQELFALFHELRSSADVSADAEARAMLPLIAKAEPVLRELAYGESELSVVQDRRLHDLAKRFPSVEEVSAYLASLDPPPAPVPQTDLALLSQPYHWDSLSRARARSYARRAHRFFERSETVSLADMPAFDERSRGEVTGAGGVPITRQLEPDPSSPQGGDGDLRLRIRQLAAFPAKRLPGKATGWNPAD